MKTSLNELFLIEEYLFSAPSSADRVLFEARIILQPALKDSVFWQEKTYSLIQQYGRQQLRKEIEQVHEQLFTAPEHRSFRQKIMQLFNR